jgi:DNA primase catalytic subunit
MDSIDTKIKSYYGFNNANTPKFPYKLIYDIFIRSENREVAFFTNTGGKIRHNSIRNAEQFHKKATSINKLEAIHIGAFYDSPDRMKDPESEEEEN